MPPLENRLMCRSFQPTLTRFAISILTLLIVAHLVSSVVAQETDRRPTRNREMQRAAVEVKDPLEFAKLTDDTVFSGPQKGEVIPGFDVRDAFTEQTVGSADVLAGQPHVILFQDDTPAGLRGLAGFSRFIEMLAKTSDRELNAWVVLLGDDPSQLTKMASKLRPYTSERLRLTVSKDGRDGPGALGLNRNVAQTILLACDNKVLHNFVFAQPMSRPDPHVLGGMAELMEVEREQLVAWIKKGSVQRARQNGMQGKRGENMQRENTRQRGRGAQADADDAAMVPKLSNQSMLTSIVKSPKEFYAAGQPIFSGPQPGEPLPPMTITDVRSDASATVVGDDPGQPVMLICMDDSEVSEKITYYYGRLTKALAAVPETRSLRVVMAILGDDPQEPLAMARRSLRYAAPNTVIGIGRDGRDGPGAFGLNRNVAVTILLAKDGQVTHNFAFPSATFEINPHVLGGLSELLEVPSQTLAAAVSASTQKSGQSKMKSGQSSMKSAVDAWVAWGNSASNDEIQAAMSSNKFTALPDAQQEKIRRQLLP
ncbi:MAG: hypothetical protein AAGD07_22135 [Planctomycetota bacterium]